MFDAEGYKKRLVVAEGQPVGMRAEAVAGIHSEMLLDIGQMLNGLLCAAGDMSDADITDTAADLMDATAACERDLSQLRQVVAESTEKITGWVSAAAAPVSDTDLQVVLKEPLDVARLAEAFEPLETQAAHVQAIVFHPSDFMDIRKHVRDVIDFEPEKELLGRGVMAYLWGAVLVQTTRMTPGVVAFLGDGDTPRRLLAKVWREADEMRRLAGVVSEVVAVATDPDWVEGEACAVVAPIDPHHIADVFAHVEKRETRVAALVMSPYDYADLRKWGRDLLQFEPRLVSGIQAYLWGALVVVSRKVTAGTFYAIGEAGPILTRFPVCVERLPA